MFKASNAAKGRLEAMMNKYPDYAFSDFRIVKENRLAYTTTVIGIKK